MKFKLFSQARELRVVWARRICDITLLTAGWTRDFLCWRTGVSQFERSISVTK